MILKSTIETCYYEQIKRIALTSNGLERELTNDISLNKEFITILTGIRRCGKSTLLHQLMNKIGNDVAYFNFEDPRIFGFDLNDFDKLDEIIGEKEYYFFDEIQNVDKWELFIRKLHDRKKAICITGSNASLLSKELGTRLTGRNITKELYPFTYKEFCAFINLEKNQESLEKKVKKRIR